MEKAAVNQADVCGNLRTVSAVLVACLLSFNIFAFGGAPDWAVQTSRLLIVFALVFQLFSVVLERNYLDDFSPALVVAAVLFAALAAGLRLRLVKESDGIRSPRVSKSRQL